MDLARAGELDALLDNAAVESASVRRDGDPRVSAASILHELRWVSGTGSA